MKRAFALIGIVLACCASGSATAPRQQENGGVPEALLRKFQTGVNITRWFCYLGGPQTSEQFANYFREDDFAVLKRIHATFVRLCISPDVILENGRIKKPVLASIDTAVARLQAHGLAVLWDLHDNGQMKLDAPGHDNQLFLDFWTEIARHYRGKSHGTLVFELVNEPQFQKNPEVWFALQAKAVQAVRKLDPGRTIMVSGTGWSGIDGLAKFTPLHEKNLVYTFHCYDPFFFTHQGATWAGDAVKPLRHMPFPSSPEAVSEMIGDVPADSQGLVKDFGAQRFGEAYLKSRLKIAADWAAKAKVPIVLGEFGAYPPNARPADRARWFIAMRHAIDALHVPNCLWGYDDGFGIGRTRDQEGGLVLDNTALSFYAK